MGSTASARGAGNSKTIDGKKPSRPTTFTYNQASELIELVLGTAVKLYGVWFVYIGMDGMAHPPCSRAVFFFTKVDLYHWMRTLLKVWFTLSAVISCLVTLKEISDLVWSMRKEKASRDEEAAPATRTTREKKEAPATARDREVTQLRRVSFPGHLVPFILSTEFLIKWNHINGVDSLGSTGQLIPLVIGGSGLVRVLYGIIKICRRGDYGELFLTQMKGIHRVRLYIQNWRTISISLSSDRTKRRPHGEKISTVD